MNNFRLLFELRALSVGVIVTRCDELQAVFNQLGRGKSYGNSTTHMSKLLPRLNGGGGGGCPIIVFGIRRKLLSEDIGETEMKTLQEEYKSRGKTIGPMVKRFIPEWAWGKPESIEDEE